jgi:hypothetical protein
MKPNIAALLRVLANSIEDGQRGDLWDLRLISEKERANLPGVLRDLATGQELLAIEITSLMEEPFYKKRPDARVALAAAAGIVRRGRKLTEREQLLNLTGGIREVDPELADRIEERAGLKR